MSVLDYAIRIIKATMKNHSNESFFPYFFIVGAGISVPEIPAAYEIIDECKEIYTLARTDNRLLEVELRALGILSSISDRVMRMRLLNELIDRCPDDSEDTTFVFLKYVAYL